MGWKRRAKPCERCNWPFEGEHICFDASKPCPGEGVIYPKAAPSKDLSERGRQNVQSRWEKYWEEHKERDASIVQAYQDNEGLTAIAKRYGVAYQTVRSVILRAERQTDTTIMRPRGVNNRWRDGDYVSETS